MEIKVGIQHVAREITVESAATAAEIETMKVLVEVVATPLTYAVVGFLKRREGVDTYDPATRFNPFSLRDEGEYRART